jgi:hypothetical protein
VTAPVPVDLIGTSALAACVNYRDGEGTSRPPKVARIFAAIFIGAGFANIGANEIVQNAANPDVESGGLVHGGILLLSNFWNIVDNHKARQRQSDKHRQQSNSLDNARRTCLA